MINRIVAKILRDRKHKKYLKEWSHTNAHNQVMPTGYIDPNIVLIGKMSYGCLDVTSWGHPDEFLKIGNYVSIASGVKFLLGGNHPYDCLSTYPFKVKLAGDIAEATTKGPVEVADDVWIGTNALILSGVKIGQGAIVAAGAVITKNVPPYAIVGGNPAKIIKYRFTEEIIEKLISIDFSKLDESKIVNHIDIIYKSLTLESFETITKILN